VVVRSTADAAGPAVEILYVSGSPAEVEIVGFDPRRDHWLFALTFPGGGLLSMAMGLSIWVFRIPVNPG
jgi:hypothetical protein